MIDARSKLAGKCRAVGLLRRWCLGIILVPSPAEETVGIDFAPVEIFRQRKVERSLQKSVAIRLMAISVRRREIIALRACDRRTKSIVDAVAASPLNGPGHIPAPGM